MEVESWETTSKVLPCKVWKVILYSAIYFPAMRQLNCFPMSSENICRFARIYPNVSNKTVTPCQTCPWNHGVSLTKSSNHQAATAKELSKVDLFLTDCSKIHHAPLWIRPHLHVYKPFFTGLAQLRNGDFLPSSTEATLNTCMPTSPWGQPSYWGNSDTIDAISVTQQ